MWLVTNKDFRDKIFLIFASTTPKLLSEEVVSPHVEAISNLNLTYTKLILTSL